MEIVRTNQLCDPWCCERSIYLNLSVRDSKGSSLKVSLGAVWESAFAAAELGAGTDTKRSPSWFFMRKSLSEDTLESQEVSGIWLSDNTVTIVWNFMNNWKVTIKTSSPPQNNGLTRACLPLLIRYGHSRLPSYYMEPWEVCGVFLLLYVVKEGKSRMGSGSNLKCPFSVSLANIHIKASIRDQRRIFQVQRHSGKAVLSEAQAQREPISGLGQAQVCMTF